MAKIRVKHVNYGDEVILIDEENFDPKLHQRVDPKPPEPAPAKAAPKKTSG